MISNTVTKRRTQQILLTVLIGAILFSLWPGNFSANMIGLVIAIIGGFSLPFLRQRLGKSNFIILMLAFILVIAAAAINTMVTR